MSNNEFNDFGFTIMDEHELDAVQEAQTAANENSTTVSELENRLDKLYNVIQPLLNNLAKNPEKSYIYWPNRLDKLEEFSDMLNGIYKG